MRAPYKIHGFPVGNDFDIIKVLDGKRGGCNGYFSWHGK